jgi:hypothetical protein
VDKKSSAPTAYSGEETKSNLSLFFSDHHRTRNPTGDLQQVRLHVDDLVLAVPFAGEEVFQAVGLEADGAVDKAVLVGEGVVPERVRVPERDVRRVLERATAVGAGRLRQQPALRGQATMEFLHRVDRIAEVFERVVRPEDADLAVAKRPARVGIGRDPAAVQIDRLVTRGRFYPAAQVNLPQAVLVAPAFDQRIDVPVVEGRRLGLDEPVLLAPAGVAGMDVIDVEATVDVLHPPVDVRPAQDVLIVKDRP